MRKRWYIDFQKPFSIPFLLLIAYVSLDLLTFGFGIRLWFPASAQTIGQLGAPPAPDRQTIAALSKRVDAVEQRVNSMPQAEALENRAGDLQKLLAALLTVGTIFGLALGVGTYVNLKDIQKNAERDLAEIRADFPAIARLNRKIAVMLEELRSYGNLRLEELDEDSYSAFDPGEREEILLREISFNALAFFDYGKVDAMRASAAEAFVTFGHFYGAQYLSDRERHAASLQRAMIYLSRALDTGRIDIETRVRSALGILYIWEGAMEPEPQRRKELLGQASRHVLAVLAIDDLNPRCLIAAAWMDRRENRLGEAIDRLDKLIRAAADRKLTLNQLKRYSGAAYFNRACYLACQGKMDEALRDLWESRNQAQRYGALNKRWVDALDKECGQDFAELCGGFPGDFAKMQDLSYRPTLS